MEVITSSYFCDITLKEPRSTGSSWHLMELQRLAVRYLIWGHTRAPFQRWRKMWGKEVRIEKSCSGDRKQSGRTRALQFCWTATAEWDANEVLEGKKFIRGEWQPRTVEDPIFQIKKKMKEETQRGKKIIRGYSLHDDLPKVVLLTDD